MKNIFLVTMWSGGRPAKKWQSYQRPEALPNGTGVRFKSAETKLMVEVIGSISVEEFESGKEELEAALEQDRAAREQGEGDLRNPFL